jgi:hypothetical protein
MAAAEAVSKTRFLRHRQPHPRRRHQRPDPTVSVGSTTGA